jgi:hypothetical protein
MRETSSGALFIEVHKGRDRVASRVMPVLGNVAILAVGACVFLMRNEPVCLCRLVQTTATAGEKGHFGKSCKTRVGVRELQL